VRVEAGDHAAARDLQYLVHASGLNASGIVDEAHAPVAAREGGENLERAVPAAAVRDHDLEAVRRIVLRERVANAPLDEARLVQAGDGDGDERRFFHGEIVDP
jgi:hypothetical protein